MKIAEHVSLKAMNTFGIDVNARYFAEVSSIAAFEELRQQQVYQECKRLLLGGGSNLLFTQSFDGLVIKNSIKGIEVLQAGEKDVLVKVYAGEVWHEFVLWTIDRNFAGIENLSLIPGRVGAAPMQNIGAYGVEIKDVFHELEAVDLTTGARKIFSLSDCAFGYRESVFKNKFKEQYLITSVSFKLTNLNSPNAVYRFKTEYGDIKNTLAEMQVYEPTLRAVSDAVIKIRNSKLPNPSVLGNAGSFFKNPVITKAKFEKLVAVNPVMPSYLQADGAVKVPAGWLIEQCGWKGKVVGNTGAHQSQALVLVNYGNATGKEVVELSRAIQQSVLQKFDIHIQPEVNVV